MTTPDPASAPPPEPRPHSMRQAGMPALVVLDTNVVLDLWLFQDARAEALRAALSAGGMQALVTAPMLAELADVLQRPFARAWPPTPDAVLAALQAVCVLVQAPPAGESAPAPAPPRCADPDDQCFLDLAWRWPARWLVSRDRALLALARPAKARGLHIVTPERWSPTG